MNDFVDRDLRGTRFQHVDLRDATFYDSDLRGARIRATAMHGVVMTGVELVDVTISGEVQNVTVNGVDIAPLVDAELDRRYPLRAKMRPTNADGYREAWSILEQLWDETVLQARTLEPELLHESVDGEWSFIETLRHLSFATECWLLRGILGEPAPWHPLSLPWDEAPPTEGVPNDREARPTLDEALALRLDRAAKVRSYLADLSEDQLAGVTTPVDAPGWPPAISFPVAECLSIILNEEWEHRLYAERDLAALTARPVNP